MGDKVSDFLLQRLSQWGVKRIFGYPVDGINGILGGLERHQDLFEIVQVRHEEMTAFMATLFKEIPLHHMAQPEEIARLALYLASDAAAYITGSTYIIDGGLSVNRGAF